MAQELLVQADIISLCIMTLLRDLSFRYSEAAQ